MYGIQTIIFAIIKCYVFENDVKMYGIQTLEKYSDGIIWFENDVKMYGIQTDLRSSTPLFSLRMM